MTERTRSPHAPKEACWAVIPAAGGGTRMAADRPKQYLPLGGKTVIRHVLERFGRHPLIGGIVVALAEQDAYWEHQSAPRGKPLITVTGGAERCHSVLNALRRLAIEAGSEDWVLVHDAARPCLRSRDLDRLIAGVKDHPAGGLLGVAVADTLKRVDEEGVVCDTLDRRGVWRALTPQMFRLGLLTEALEAAIADGVVVTDEAAAMERAGHRPRMIAGSADNIKITMPGDLAFAEMLLASRNEHGDY
ncbi:MAG: 2-C-methyl-D-erythritol 4-phosphate cytidylyltransferase [Gammaproteobacteria bacterium]|jgi:2-C-methyl-D-erythritol 4-phosphate cytidylyltransferase|nr:2-C-methyl-D-erythritol 4-phosphate cytidylyltransferase [Gammaproteobacteria bacterium]